MVILCQVEMSNKRSSALVFFVNGTKITECYVEPDTNLLQYLRLNLGLTGTKLGCGEGGCGACTVMVSRYDRACKKILHYSAVSCLVPICSLHGCAVTTVEGIGSVRKGLHPVQERLAKAYGTQCGFCSPGMVMSMYTLLRNNPQPSTDNIEKCLQGNLCRCTGYSSILDGFRTFSKEYCKMGERCCQNKEIKRKGKQNGIQQADLANFPAIDSTQDPIFPPELQNSDTYEKESLVFHGEGVVWHRPTSLTELLDLKAQNPHARLVNGNTKLGVGMGTRNQALPVLIDASHIQELNEITHTEQGMRVGASVTLNVLNEELQIVIQNMPDYQTRVFAAVVEMLRWFGGDQIRNVATVGGSIASASPVSDLNTLFLACEAQLTIISKARGERQLKMDSTFFTGNQKTAIAPDETLLNVLVPSTSKLEFFYAYKQAYRRDDTAIVNAAMRVVFEDKSNIIKEMNVAYGGIGDTIVTASKTTETVVGKAFEDSLLPEMYKLLVDDLSCPPRSTRGMDKYRRTLAVSLFFKFYLTVQLQLQSRRIPLTKTQVLDYFESATSQYTRDPIRGSQVYQKVAPDQLSDDPVGRPLLHESALEHTTGEAKYVDDIPKLANELHLAFVYSIKAHALIKSVDPSEALSMPGVKDYVCYSDIPGQKTWGPVLPDDEELMASEEVFCQGQIIGAVVAETAVQAQRAARAVEVDYEDRKAILTIQEAIREKSFHLEPMEISYGNMQNAVLLADHVIEGESHVAGQSHFYMETNAALAVPKGEKNEMEMFVSTQNPKSVQMTAARALDIPANRVSVRVKRVGGGFGGKGERSTLYATVCAIAANKLQCPVRFMLTRDDDMVMTGGRHPVIGKYKVGFTEDGKVVSLELEMFFNAGMSLDLSDAVSERALFHCDNAYRIPNVHIVAHLCKTNLPSNTAFRGFGIPQAMMIAENWISTIATSLGISPVKIREMNLYQEGDVTYFNQQLTDCLVQRCWDECKKHSDYSKRKKDVDAFNSENRWKKRGVTMVPLKFGSDITELFLNQAGALVHIYTDGSVLLTHAGVELGQGLYTKMIQVASRVLGIPTSKIHTCETGTNTVPNTSPTAGSASSDLNGMAIMNACQDILKRLQRIKNENPDGSWEDWITTAYFRRISLSATGFYKTPDLEYDLKTNYGTRFNYFSYGAACSEVEIDCLTGSHQVIRSDIVMDVGKSLNPAVDIGQIEGGFVQGFGMMMLEEPKRSTTGYLYTRGTDTYKIPTLGDIPTEFNVTLLKDSENPKAVYSSKAIGEPPLFLAASVFHAVKEAIMASRVDAGFHGPFRLDSPATPERIRLACEDQFTKMFQVQKDSEPTPYYADI